MLNQTEICTVKFVLTCRSKYTIRLFVDLKVLNHLGDEIV